MSHAQAIVFDAPRTLAVRSLELKAFEHGDLEVEVGFSGISTGTERLLWDYSVEKGPTHSGFGYPLNDFGRAFEVFGRADSPFWARLRG